MELENVDEAAEVGTWKSLNDRDRRLGARRRIQPALLPQGESNYIMQFLKKKNEFIIP